MLFVGRSSSTATWKIGLGAGIVDFVNSTVVVAVVVDECVVVVDMDFQGNVVVVVVVEDNEDIGAAGAEVVVGVVDVVAALGTVDTSLN